MRYCMLLSTALGLSFLAAPCQGEPFLSRSGVFGLGRGGGGAKDKVVEKGDEEYERAEKAILDAVTRVEHKVQKAIEAEVDTLFHEREDHHVAKKSEVSVKAKQAIQKGVGTVKRTVDDHAERHVYPFENDQPFPYALPKQSNDDSRHGERRILHAVESAEKAVLHAIQAEVDTLFHPTSSTDEHHHEDKKKTQEKVHIGVQQASAKVKDMQNHRREWFDRTSALLDDYTSHEYFLE